MESRRRRTSDAVFLPLHRRDDHEVNPSSLRSEKRRHRPTGDAIAESSLHSDSAGRCGSGRTTEVGAAPAALMARHALGLLLRSATRRDLAPASGHHLASPRDPRDEALRAPPPPTGGSGQDVSPENTLHSRPRTPNRGRDEPIAQLPSSRRQLKTQNSKLKTSVIVCDDRLVPSFKPARDVRGVPTRETTSGRSSREGGRGGVLVEIGDVAP